MIEPRPDTAVLTEAGRPHLELVVDSEAATEPNEASQITRESLDQIIETEGLGVYRELVADLEIPNPEQYEMVAELEALFAEKEAREASGLTVDEQLAKIEHIRHSLFLGNLNAVLTVVQERRRAGHRSPIVRLVHESNRLAEGWFRRTYSSYERIHRRAPVYPRNIVAYDEVNEKLQKSAKTGIRKPQRRKPKPPAAPPPEPMFGEAEDNQLYSYDLLGRYKRPPRVETTGKTALETRRSIRVIGQLSLPFPTPERQHIRVRRRWRRIHNISVSDPGDLTRFTESKKPNPNSAADTPADRAVLEWLQIAYGDHPSNRDTVRYTRDFQGFSFGSEERTLRDAPYHSSMTPHEYFLAQAHRYPLLDGLQHEATLAHAIKAGILAQHRIDAADYDTPEELTALHHAALRGTGAYLTFFQSNLRPVNSIAKRYPTSETVDIMDHIQDGMEGLARAIEKYDPFKGFKFSTYATWWIRQAITRKEGEMAFDARLPVATIEAFREIRHVMNEYHREHGAFPSDAYLVEQGISTTNLVAFRTFSSKQRVSMDAPVNSEGDASRYDLIGSDEDALEGFEPTTHELLVAFLSVDSLTARERLILSVRWGVFLPDIDYDRTVEVVRDEQPVSLTIREIMTEQFMKTEAVTLEDVGAMSDLTRERVRQIEQIAVGKLYIDHGLRGVTERMNLSDDEAYIAAIYFSVDAQTPKKHERLMNAEQEVYQQILDIMNLCDPHIPNYIDEYVSQHFGKESMKQPLREWLQARFGIAGDMAFTFWIADELFGVPRDVALAAEAYVLARAGGIVGADTTKLDTRMKINAKNKASVSIEKKGRPANDSEF